MEQTKRNERNCEGKKIRKEESRQANKQGVGMKKQKEESKQAFSRTEITMARNIYGTGIITT